MKDPQINDALLIENSCIIGKQPIVARIERVSFINDKVFAKISGKLWYDITYFVYKDGWWQDNDKTTDVVLYEGPRS